MVVMPLISQTTAERTPKTRTGAKSHSVKTAASTPTAKPGYPPITEILQLMRRDWTGDTVRRLPSCKKETEPMDTEPLAITLALTASTEGAGLMPRPRLSALIS